MELAGAPTREVLSTWNANDSRSGYTSPDADDLGCASALRELGAGVLLGASLLCLTVGGLNPGTTLLNASAVMVEAGVMLAAAYMVTRRLWLCIGIHIAWNFTEGGIFSAAVSGGDTKGLLQPRLTGADWLTGGAFGVEGSAVALAICAAAGILLLAKAVRKGSIVQPFWSAKSSIGRTL
jgi:CAAX protease family protein